MQLIKRLDLLILVIYAFDLGCLQRLIFDKAKNGVRKIVLATNIAETSITIDDVVFVIDCGKAKETSYDALNNTPCLLPSWISKVSAKQVSISSSLIVHIMQGPTGTFSGFVPFKG